MLRENIEKFIRARDGSTALIVGIALVTVAIGILIGSIDVNKSSYASALNQNALDSAVISTGVYIEKMQSRSVPAATMATNVNLYAKKAYKDALRTQSSFASLATSSSGENFQAILLEDKVILKSCVTVYNSFNKPTTAQVCNKAAASFGAKPTTLQDTEIAIGLDISYSMASKYNYVRDAITAIMTEYSSPKTYWALVPYKGMVNIAPYQDFIVKNDYEDLDPTIPTGASGFKVMNVVSKSYTYATDPAVNVSGVMKKVPRQSVFGSRDNLTSVGSSSVIGLRPFETSPTLNYEKGYYKGSRGGFSCTFDYLLAPQYRGNTVPYGGLISLQAIPLTERVNGSSAFDDTAPQASLSELADTRFKAYWHHDKKVTFGMSHEYSAGMPVRITPATKQCGRYLGGTASGGTGGGGS